MKRETLHEIGEFGFIKRIARGSRKKDTSVLVGIGDDAAVVNVGAGHAPAQKGQPQGLPLLVTTDTLVEDVHFRRDSPPADLGWKALAVNISDIAAMGGIPRYYLLSLSLPESVSVEYLYRFFSGMRAAATKYGMTLIGGDTTSSPDRIYISITVLGETSNGALLRNGAKPGNIIFVTGTLGDSALGFKILEESRGQGVKGSRKSTRTLGPSDPRRLIKRHLRPTPRVKEGVLLAKSGLVTSMIDISDGLLADLGHVCEESGVGARLWIGKLPLSRGFRSQSGKYGGVELALSGGEDYELLFTANGHISSFLKDTKGIKCTPIGEIVKKRGITVVGPDGDAYIPKGRGYDHFKR